MRRLLLIVAIIGFCISLRAQPAGQTVWLFYQSDPTGLHCPGTKYLAYSATTHGNFYCSSSLIWTVQSGGGSGITSLNGLTTGTQLFANSNDTNVTLAISSVTATHTFTLGWTGTLAKARALATTVYTDQSNTYSTGTQDFHGAVHTLPAVSGVAASKPATCTVSEMYFATDATAGQNWYFCTATNTWTQQLNSGGANAAATHSVSFSATPTYTGNSTTLDTVDQFIVGQLTGNITSSTVSTLTPGQAVSFVFTQASAAVDTVAMPSNWDGCPVGAAAAGTVVTCAYSYDGTNGRLTGVVFGGAGTPGVAVNTQSGATYTVLSTDRVKMVLLTNNTTSTAVTLPQAGGTGFANNFAFEVCNAGTVIATITPTTSTINGNATIKLPAVTASGTPACAFIYADGSNNYWSNQGVTLDANGKVTTLGAATATSLLATGIVDGEAPITVTTGSSATLGGTYASGYTFNQEATAATAVTYTLPTAAAGKQYCVANSYNGSAADTGTLELLTSASGQFLIFTDGTLSATGGYVISGGAARDAACVVGVDSTHWMFYPSSGSWTKH